MARHSLHSSKLSFVFGTEAISQEIGIPEDLAEIWNERISVGTRTPTSPGSNPETQRLGGVDYP